MARRSGMCGRAGPCPAVVVPAAGRHPRWRRSVSTKVDTCQGPGLQSTFDGPVRQRLGTSPKRCGTPQRSYWDGGNRRPQRPVQLSSRPRAGPVRRGACAVRADSRTPSSILLCEAAAQRTGTHAGQLGQFDQAVGMAGVVMQVGTHALQRSRWPRSVRTCSVCISSAWRPTANTAGPRLRATAHRCRPARDCRTPGERRQQGMRNGPVAALQRGMKGPLQCRQAQHVHVQIGRYAR